MLINLVYDVKDGIRTVQEASIEYGEAFSDYAVVIQIQQTEEDVYVDNHKKTIYLYDFAFAEKLIKYFGKHMSFVKVKGSTDFINRFRHYLPYAAIVSS